MERGHLIVVTLESSLEVKKWGQEGQNTQKTRNLLVPNEEGGGSSSRGKRVMWSIWRQEEVTDFVAYVIII